MPKHMQLEVDIQLQLELEKSVQVGICLCKQWNSNTFKSFDVQMNIKIYFKYSLNNIQYVQN
jgi:hypothetical protein